MIGVACAIDGTFGANDSIEATAVERAVSALVQSGIIPDEQRAIDVREAFAAGFGPALDLSPFLETARAMARFAGQELVAHRFDPFPDVRSTLAELRAMNVPMAALAGGWSGIDHEKAAAVGFDGAIVVANELGFAASDPAAFAAIATALQLPAECIWFIGSDPAREILPALTVGMHAIYIDREQRGFPAASVAPDATVTSFAACLDVLSAPYTRGLLALRNLLRTTLEWRPGHFVNTLDAMIVHERKRDDES